MNNDIEKVLISEEELEAHVAEIGRRITEDFKDKDPIFVGVLKGCFIQHHYNLITRIFLYLHKFFFIFLCIPKICCTFAAQCCAN